MKRSEMIDWLKIAFQPVELATPDPTLAQILEDAIRYWNSHSAFKVVRMYNTPPPQGAVQVDADIKTVVRVFPATTTTWILNDHPLWSLLGVTILDNVTSDLIVMSEAFRNYRVYVGTDFRWTFVKSDNPAVGGSVYAINLPYGNTKICVEGTKRIAVGDEDVKVEHILSWLLNYFRALVKITEGNTLRKADIINVKNDGDRLITEGTKDKEDLENQLAQEARWLCFAKRF